MKDTKDIKDVNNMKLRYRVSKRNFFSRLTWILLGLSAVFTLMANWGFWNVEDEYFIYLQVILPVVSCILYMLIINHMGEKLFFLTFIPVILGAAFLIVNEANSKQPLHSILIITLCIVVAVSYIMTVFGAIRTKWLLLPIFGLPLAYRVVVEDHDIFFSERSTFSLGEWLPELAVLCMIFAMLFIVFAMKKRDFTKTEKPIEDVLVELEENFDSEDTIEETGEQTEAQKLLGQTDNEATIIAPTGEKYE